MTDEMRAAYEARRRLSEYLSRSGCTPCDRSEAGHQFAMQKRRMADLASRVSILSEE